MKITKKQLRRIIREAFDRSFTPHEIGAYLSDNAKEYHEDPMLAPDGPSAIKMLLQDDFMDDIGHVASIDDYEDLIDQLSQDPNAWEKQQQHDANKWHRDASWRLYYDHKRMNEEQ